MFLAQVKSKEREREKMVEAAKAAGRVLECPVCCKDDLLKLDMVQCSNVQPHTFCIDCLRRQVDENMGQSTELN